MVICPTKKCEEIIQYAETCFVITNNGTGDCNVPCSMSSCETEVVQETECRFWVCDDLPTTTTPSPKPFSSNLCDDYVCVSSLVTNAIFVIGFSLVLFFYVKHKRRQRQLAQWLLSSGGPSTSTAGNTRAESQQNLPEAKDLPRAEDAKNEDGQAVKKSSKRRSCAVGLDPLILNSSSDDGFENPLATHEGASGSFVGASGSSQSPQQSTIQVQVHEEDPENIALSTMMLMPEEIV